jgi:transcriptional regulator
MYTPAAFQVTDRGKLHEFLEQHSFATLAASTPQGLEATHLPLLLDREVGPWGRLTGHMARANPLWRLAAEQPVLAIFTGPQAYVSPSWYAARDVVPTWNYTAVHASGVLRLMDDPVRMTELLRRSVGAYEASRGNPWSLESVSPEFFARMLAGIMGFEIEITRLEGKWKLSQNHSAERQEYVRRGLQAEGSPESLAVAALMTERLAAPE